ncbi:iron chelate uptake ABC transporter family permease subunit [Enterovirga sp.]|uniref:iron chelate uptake ABC transporter family permease subunit n=1 Tax=Enterovirga sp. TaxID=2026350 RepID=UPI002D1FAFF6|nr:iron chelate uptake ABC transporter family permease subunit [Enterovirga sp.]
MNARAPRVVKAMLAGAGLAMAGAATQGVFRNPPVSPHLLGISSGPPSIDMAEAIQGAAGEVMTEANLSRLYGIDIRRLTVTDAGSRPFAAVIPHFGGG